MYTVKAFKKFEITQEEYQDADQAENRFYQLRSQDDIDAAYIYIGDELMMHYADDQYGTDDQSGIFITELYAWMKGIKPEPLGKNWSQITLDTNTSLGWTIDGLPRQYILAKMDSHAADRIANLLYALRQTSITARMAAEAIKNQDYALAEHLCRAIYDYGKEELPQDVVP